MELMKEFSSVSCPCGKPHTFDAKIIVGSGVIAQIPGILADLTGGSYLPAYLLFTVFLLVAYLIVLGIYARLNAEKA